MSVHILIVENKNGDVWHQVFENEHDALVAAYSTVAEFVSTRGSIEDQERLTDQARDWSWELLDPWQEWLSSCSCRVDIEEAELVKESETGRKIMSRKKANENVLASLRGPGSRGPS
jgi:hypothetical protein